MTDEMWRRFFVIASRYIRGTLKTELSQWVEAGGQSFRTSYCAWTTFDRLGYSTIYWTGGLPLEKDLGVKGINDGGEWGQPFSYSEIAHLIIPAKFDEESYGDGRVFRMWEHTQDIAGLSDLLKAESVPHNLLPNFLELKLY